MNVLDSLKLKGKNAVVTGAAGRYTKQIVEALAEAGAKVFAADYDLKALDVKIKEFHQAGLDVVPVQFDQGSEESICNLFKEVTASSTKIDILVNSAVTRPMKDWDSPAEDFAKSMQVNATGIFIITRIFGDHMAANGGGSIINIASIQGNVGPDYTLYEGLGWGMPADYFFHKGGMIQLTKYAASKLGPKGVRVNAISPGGFAANQGEPFTKRYNARTFLGRLANDEDLKGIIVLLASDASAYITGANIPVDGGYMAK